MPHSPANPAVCLSSGLVFVGAVIPKLFKQECIQMPGDEWASCCGPFMSKSWVKVYTNREAGVYLHIINNGFCNLTYTYSSFPFSLSSPFSLQWL